MSLSSEQLDFKDQGNAALKAGSAGRAVELFSEAINMSGGSDAGRALLYSNRAAACTMLKDYASALEDAEKCVQLDPEFAKGWSRKGVALQNLGRLAEAAEAYKTASRKTSNREEAQGYLGWAEQCAGNSQHQSNGNSSYPESSLVLTPLTLALRIISFLMSFSWFVTGEKQHYTVGMLLMFLSCFITIIEKLGRPRLSSGYAEAFLRDQTKPFFLLPLVFTSMSATPPSIFCTQFVAIGPLGRSVNQYVAKVSPSTAASLASRVESSSIMEKFVGDPSWPSLSSEQRFVRFNARMEDVCARFEVAVMLILTLQLFTPAGNILSVIIYPQVLKLRFLTNEPTKKTILAMDSTLSEFSRRHFLLERGYEAIRSLVVWFGTQGIENATARTRGQYPTACNIM